MNVRAAVAAAALVASAPLFAARVYVTNERAGTLTVIDSNTDTVIATARIGNRPRGISLSPDGKRVYIAVSRWRDRRAADARPSSRSTP